MAITISLMPVGSIVTVEPMGASHRHSTLAASACLSIGGGCATEVVGEPPAALDEAALLADNGIFLDNGLELTNGSDIGNGIKLTNGFNLANGIDLANGIKLTNGANTIAPPPDSDLERWIDVDPTMRLRIIRYEVECALAPDTAVEVIYREQSFTFTGLTGLGTSWLEGMMTATDQERVSACLLARVNTRGRVLRITLTGPYSGLDTVTSADLASYPNREATYYGNLFQTLPAAYIAGFGCGSRACMPGPNRDTCYCGIVATGGLCGYSDLPYDTGCWDSSLGAETYFENPITVYVAQEWPGGACASDADCIYYNCAAGGICGGAGAACNFGEMCDTSCSDDHVCGGAGLPCSVDSDCASNHCAFVTDEDFLGTCS